MWEKGGKRLFNRVKSLRMGRTHFRLPLILLPIGTVAAVMIAVLISNGPNNVENTSTNTSRARLHIIDNRYDEAITEIDAAIELVPDDPALYLLRAQTYLLLYEWDKVLADCNKAVELDPTYAEAYYQRGLLYYSILQTGSSLYKEALADFEMYLDLAPNGEQAKQAAQYIAEIEALMRALGE